MGGSGLGKYATESNLAKFLKSVIARNSVISGFTVPASDADLTISVAAGEALIEGYIVTIDTATNVTVTASATNHVYLQLTRDGSQNVTGAQFVVNTTGIAPSDSVKLFTCVASASAITSTTDARPLSIFDAAGGHKHSGAAGDAPLMSAQALGVFGDGSDGAFNSTGNTTFAVGADDAGPVVKQYSSFTLNAGHTMTVDRRCKGLIVKCTGDVIISGTLHMNNFAARATRDAGSMPWVSLAQVGYKDYVTGLLLSIAVAAGGTGGAGGASNVGAVNGGSNCAYGGSGGAGGNSRDWAGGVGNVGGGTGGAGGAGNGGGSAGAAGGAGGGGLIVIIAKGSITINSGGVVSANSTGAGGAGGNAGGNAQTGGGGGGAGNGGAGTMGATYSNNAYGGAGGGGAGGGVAILLYGGSYTNSGAVQVNASAGGAGGVATGATSNTNGQAGSAGGVGSIISAKVGV